MEMYERYGQSSQRSQTIQVATVGLLMASGLVLLLGHWAMPASLFQPSNVLVSSEVKPQPWLAPRRPVLDEALNALQQPVTVDQLGPHVQTFNVDIQAANEATHGDQERYMAGGIAALAGLFAATTVGYAMRLRRRHGPHTPLLPQPTMLMTMGQQGDADVSVMVNVLRRTAWVPFVEDQGGRPILSHFGGSPLLKSGEEWPVCGKCSKSLTLFLQLDLEVIPSDMQPAVGSEGLLQVFICAAPTTRCTQSCCGRQELPSDDSEQPYLIRIIPKEDTYEPTSRMSGVYFDPMSITYWHAVDDYPRTVMELISIYPALAGSSRLDAWDRSNCSWGEKMGGWPLWAKEPKYLRCAACDCEMNVIFQFDSDCNLDHVWGRNGTAFVHSCPHCQKLGFNWVDGSSM